MLDEALFNYMGKIYLKILKKEFPDKWKYLTKKVRYRNEYFNCVDDYQKPFENIKKEYFFSELKNKRPSDKEKERKKN